MDISRGPNHAAISAHRARIRELMIEKEHYTQRYLEEKRKYDELLDKVNSTSTLGSFILMTAASTSREMAEPGQSGQAACRPLESAAITTAVRGSSALGQPHVASTEATAETQPASQVISTSLGTSPHTPTAPSTPPSLTPRLAPVHASAASCPPSPTSPPTSADGPRKRDQAAKTAKKVAKGAGIALSVTIAIALFPLTIPAYIFIVRRKLRMSGPKFDYEGEEPGYLDNRTEGRPHMLSLASEDIRITKWLRAPPAPYQSEMMMAELPAFHELPEISPDMALVGRLLNTDIERR
jgi:hypothetical protein